MAQLDSESALRVAVKLASPDKVINRLAAELALTLEQWGLDALTGQHWRNVITSRQMRCHDCKKDMKSRHDSDHSHGMTWVLSTTSSSSSEVPWLN